MLTRTIGTVSGAALRVLDRAMGLGRITAQRRASSLASASSRIESRKFTRNPGSLTTRGNSAKNVRSTNI